ncbi:MAG: ribonuclease J [Firmicutes bacterium HGW-Firmicutes-13]|nr:MAG: ribonuclease J [Firmicutes bacterium HGW-Firmicutes-13]
MSKEKQNKIQIIPLGGIGEIGKNMFVLKYEEELLILDSGLMFPEEEMFGIDIVIPDISYLIENKEKIKGIIVTHGHEDHIGALPYILPSLDVPVYGTKLTLGLVEVKLKEHNILKNSSLNLIKPGCSMKISDNFSLEFFRTNHSIPDSVGLAVYTPVGIIVYTSDFKFDQTPVNGELTDYYRLAELGKKGVLVLLSDSTNAERPGYTLSEKVVGETIEEIFRVAEGRVIIATFASNVHRIQQVMNAAVLHGRKVAVIGRSMVNVVGISRELGYLQVPEKNIIEVEEIGNYPENKLVLLTTGSQGEPMSALTRISVSDHKKVEIIPGDSVIIAATPIPGNEKLVSRTIDNLFKRGAKVYYESVSGVHVSGHGSKEELKLMLNLIQPKYFIPVHGEYRHLIHHAELAEKVGIPSKNIFVTENGSVLEFNSRTGKKVGKVPVGKVLVDGLGVGDVGNIVLRDRKILSQDGILIVVIAMDKDSNEILAGPDIVSRGFVYVRESEGMIEEAKNQVARALQSTSMEKMGEWSTIKTIVKDVLGKYFWEKTRRKPMILPIISEI